MNQISNRPLDMFNTNRKVGMRFVIKLFAAFLQTKIAKKSFNIVP